MQNHPWCVCVCAYRYSLVYLRLFAVIMLAQKKEQWIISYNIKRNQLVFPPISFGNGHFPIDSASSFSAMSQCPWFDSQSPESVSSEQKSSFPHLDYSSFPVDVPFYCNYGIIQTK